MAPRPACHQTALSRCCRRGRCRGQSLPACFGQVPQSGKIAGPHGCGCLDFDPGGHAVIALQHDVNLMHLLVPEMMGSQFRVRCCDQFHHLRIHKALKEWTESPSIRLDSGKRQAARCGKKAGVVPVISARASGSNRRVSIRPARLSAPCGNVITFADPVNRKRPGRQSSSTDFLIANSSSGARWISSRMTRSKPRRKPAGSARAASSIVWLSSVTYVRPSCPIFRASVVLPACRGPTIRTTGVSETASLIRCSRNRSCNSLSTGWKLGEQSMKIGSQLAVDWNARNCCSASAAS